MHAPLPANPASYLGVFENGSPPHYGPIDEFAQAAGKEPNLIGYYSGWAQPFATSFAESMHSHGLIPFVQIDPTLASVSAIASGDYDDYLRQYADSVRDYGHAVVIGFGHEMNATWYSWGYGHVPGVDVRSGVAAHRDAVPRTGRRQRHLAVDHPGGPVPSTGPIVSWWPGASYVTWVGIDGYYLKPSDTFDSVFGPDH